MSWRVTHDPDVFLAAVAEFATARRVELTVPLGVVANLREHGPDLFGGEPPHLGWWDDGHGTRGVATRTPPHRLVVSDLPREALDALPHSWPADGLPGLQGPATVAPRVADAWCAIHGGRWRVVTDERLHRLDVLAPPTVAGTTRRATSGDRDLLLAWVIAFGEEAGPDGPAPRPARLDAQIAAGRVLLHTVDGRGVSMASVSMPAVGASRIGPVYTPPEERCHGYAAAATAAASRQAFEDGADEVLLFTDLANPTSNALYARLGFVPVAEYVEIAFSV